MPNKKYEADGVPERLRQITVETLPVEAPYIPDLDPYTELQEVLMSVWVQGDEGGLRQGVVADCRQYDGQFDLVDGAQEIDFTDQEEAWDILEVRQHQVVISAVVDNDSNGKTKVWGDPAFYDAAIHMAKLINKEAKKHTTAKTRAEEKSKKSHKKLKKPKR